MIQGGGYDKKLHERPSQAPIRNEASNGLRNLTGTIAMARTGDPHSATSQFFINTADNGFLDHREKSPSGWGYAVFGKVVKGMDVVRAIESTRTTRQGPFENLPSPMVIILKIETVR
jgi:peptidyl-prolyl cis-trans isomerase B (cyclophilin B)